LTNLEELQIDPWLDPQDPDTDGDGIDDRLDRDPIVADNACAAAGSADVSFTEVVTGVLSCGATASIVAMPPAEIETQGDLLLVALSWSSRRGSGSEAGFGSGPSIPARPVHRAEAIGESRCRARRRQIGRPIDPPSLHLAETVP